MNYILGNTEFLQNILRAVVQKEDIHAVSAAK
ncbi:unnamed protein product [Acanthoscelides obtectus]|uniref:Uncharacterized protein n=1 Tax=Acanthoscelides obtectus TaxID=200917 RepID=A0A9P0JJ19_ACAOB|nr:unnamed protein product [Acanthoscelides obtectus]CAK1649881.1 hypothetical protein AOBTE_LOCUS16472 [Acanthoscelides obtectus]